MSEQAATYAWITEHYPQVLTDPQAVPIDQLHRIIHEAVLSRRLPSAESKRLSRRLLDELVGPGLLTPYFDDPAVTEIMVVGDRIYVERHGTIHLAARLLSSQIAIDLAQHLCDHCHEEYQTSQPLINLTWPENGARINIVHHSVSPTGVAITVRKRNQERLLDLPDLLAANMLSEEAALFLVEAARSKMNILFSGPPGSGKTSVLRGIAAAAIDPRERVVVLEDTEELRLPLEHMMVFLGQTEDPTPEERRRGLITIHEFFRNALRQRPDRIIVGEIRGVEAFDLIQAGVTAEGGIFSTVHLRRPDTLLERLLLIAERYGFRVSLDGLKQIIPKAIDVIVQVDQDATRHRHITRIVESLPDASWQDLFVWDPPARQLVVRGTLTAGHQAWMDHHRSQRQDLARSTEGWSDVWADVLRPF